MTRVLIAYASKYGSVEEVARYVGAVLRDRGASCAVTPAREAEEVVGYDLVVLGTGLYMGRMHRDARRFLSRHHEALEHMPFAVFAMGPLSGEDAEKENARPHLQRGLDRYPALDPSPVTIFGGVIDPEKLSFPFTHMPAGDHRDWDEIREFASRFRSTSPSPFSSLTRRRPRRCRGPRCCVDAGGLRRRAGPARPRSPASRPSRARARGATRASAGGTSSSRRGASSSRAAGRPGRSWRR